MAQMFDGPIELKDIKTPPLSPYSQSTFKPYDPIIGGPSFSVPKMAHLRQVSRDIEKDLEYLSIPNRRLQQRVLLMVTLLCSFVLVYLIHNYEPLKLVYNSHLITILIGSLSSVEAQLINQFYKRSYNLSSILKFTVWGCINGILTSLWIELLIFHFPNLFVRVAVDQLVGSPFFQLVFLVLSSIWDRNDIRSTLKVNYFRSLKLSYLIWPSFSLLSFSILPPELIFPCNCLVNLIWNVILSFIT